MPCGTKIQYQMAESDLYYRKEEFEVAKELLLKSLDEVEKFGYKTEEPKITQVVDYS
jgi:BMFP domain-containing protein YqiC